MQHTTVKSNNRKSQASVPDTEHTEGEVAKAIEEQTAKLPSDIFLWGAMGTMIAAISLVATGKKHTGLLVGQFVAPILLLGVYNKLVKQQGHDKIEK